MKRFKEIKVSSGRESALLKIYWILTKGQSSPTIYFDKPTMVSDTMAELIKEAKEYEERYANA
jgi:hypothetical protein